MRARAGLLLSALLVAACAPRELVYGWFGHPPPALRDFGPEFKPPLSNETDQPVSGFGGEGGGITHTPVIFVHGNTVAADYWLPARRKFKQAGYTDDELWAVGYGWDSVRAFDNATLSAVTLERFVQQVQADVSKKAGHRVEQFDLIGHSLGVTVVREWMRQTNSYHKVRNFIAVSGANHGVWTSREDARGQNRVVAFELFPGSPWLAQLNRFGETPGATVYHTLYDGGGYADVLFPKPHQDSGRLEGATNLAYNRERGSFHDHLQMGRADGPVDTMLAWLKESPEPLPGKAPPNLVRVANTLTASQPDAMVHCVAGGEYPRVDTPGAARVELPANALMSCYARNTKSLLVSPIARYKAGTGAINTAALTLSASPEGGAYQDPVKVALTASDPDAFITYTTTGNPAGTGSPLYAEPVYVPGPLTLMAQAQAPDGRVSAPLRLDFNISIEKIDAARAWDRQLDPGAEERYAARRKKGN